MIDTRQTTCLAGHMVGRWIYGLDLDRHCDVCVSTNVRFAALLEKREDASE